jgi:membrane protease YdiL (CAAX protease family)
VLVVLAPAIAWCLVRRVDLRAALLWRRPAGGTLPGALLVGLGGFYVTAALIEWAMEKVAPVPPALRTQMKELIAPSNGLRPFALDWTMLALLPAICEEALFRGAILSAFGVFAGGERKATRAASRGEAEGLAVGRVAAVMATALLFGFYHGSLWKLVPTASLGLVLGWVAVRARSLAAPVLVHLTNNTLVLVLVRAGREDPPPPDTPIGALLVVMAVAALALGLHLLGPRSRRDGG